MDELNIEPVANPTANVGANMVLALNVLYTLVGAVTMAIYGKSAFAGIKAKIGK